MIIIRRSSGWSDHIGTTTRQDWTASSRGHLLTSEYHRHCRHCYRRHCYHCYHHYQNHCYHHHQLPPGVTYSQVNINIVVVVIIMIETIIIIVIIVIIIIISSLLW